jgi:hypothetical protein
MWGLQTTKKMREDQYKEIREIIAKEVVVIHKHIEKNPLLERGQAVRELIEAGKIRNIHPLTHLANYRTKYGKSTKINEVLQRELVIIKNYITKNKLVENLETLEKVVEKLKKTKEIRNCTSGTYTIRSYRKKYVPHLKEQRGKPKKQDSFNPDKNLTLEKAKKNVKYFEKYHFEGRIITEEMRKSLELIKK